MYKRRQIYWGAIILDGLKYMLKQNLKMSDFQVLIYLMDIMDNQNRSISSQKELALNLNLNPGTISRAIGRLNNSQLITKIHGGYMINPNFFYVMKNAKYDRIELREKFQATIEENGEKLKVAFNESKRKFLSEEEIEYLIDNETSQYIYD